MKTVNLFDFYNEKNKLFMEKSINNDKKCLGIYSAKLKEIAKNQKDFDYILEEKEYQDEFMICAYLFNYIKDYDLMLKYLLEFIKQVTNWAICDSLVSSLKLLKKNKDRFLNDIDKFYNDNEYSLRFILVTLKCYYLEKEYLNIVFDYLNKINKETYYIKMAKAWLICDMLIKFYDETYSYLKNTKLDKELTKYLIRKVKDTYRLTDLKKEEIVKLLGA